MVRVHYDGGGRYRTSGHLFEAGDVADINADLAEYLCAMDAFARVEDAPITVSSDDTADDEREPESKPEGFDVEAWLDQHYQARSEQVRDGDVDEHLDAIAAEETATTVQDAIGERRAELEA